MQPDKRVTATNNATQRPNIPPPDFVPAPQTKSPSGCNPAPILPQRNHGHPTLSSYRINARLIGDRGALHDPGQQMGARRAGPASETRPDVVFNTSARSAGTAWRPPGVAERAVAAAAVLPSLASLAAVVRPLAAAKRSPAVAVVAEPSRAAEAMALPCGPAAVWAEPSVTPPEAATATRAPWEAP